MDLNPVGSEERTETAVAESRPVPALLDPPWTGWDIAFLCLVSILAIFIVRPLVVLAATHIFYSGVPWATVAQKPVILLSTQFVWYALVLLYMVMFVEGTFHRRFWETIRWNWPRYNWGSLAFLGALTVSLDLLVRFFKVPQHVPMEEFLSTPQAAVLTGILAVTVGPLMEELFFRGFLYPVLARRFGIAASVVATSLLFGFVHGAQLAFAWGLVFIIFLVGIVLTTVRAKTGSVGASFVVHVAYNSTLVILGIIGSQHVDKIPK